MHDLIIVGVPVLAIFAGILFNRNDVKELRAEMMGRFDGVNRQFDGVNARFNGVDDRFIGLNARFDAIQSDLRQFYHLTGKLEGRMDAIEKKR